MKVDSNYNRVHKWIRSHYGNAIKCENKDCQYRKPKRFEWALITGKKYEKNINNFIQLCCSCHRKYDFTEEARKKQKKKASRKRPYRRKPVLQKSVDGKLIRSHLGIKDASSATGISRTAIANVLSNRAKTAGGYIWEYH